MGVLKKNIGFFAIDLIPLLAAQPHVCSEMLSELAAPLDGGALRPPPYTEYPIGKAVEAFATWRKPGISARSSSRQAQIRKQPPWRLSATGGGAAQRCHLPRHGRPGRAGLQLAVWPAEHGAKHLVLLRRQSATPDACARLAALAAQVTEILVKQADAASAAELGAVWTRCAVTPAARVVSRGVSADGPLMAMYGERMAGVLAPKADGAWLLHCLTRHLELDLFVMCLCNSRARFARPGQLHCRQRIRCLGALPPPPGAAGPRHQLGSLGRSRHGGPRRASGEPCQVRYSWLAAAGRIGAVGTSPPDIRHPGDGSACRLGSAAAKFFASHARGDRRRDTAQANTGPSPANPLRAQLRDLDPAERHGLVVNVIRQQFVQVLRMPVAPDRFCTAAAREVGVDSLTTVG